MAALLLVAVVVAAIVWTLVRLHPMPARHLVMASGPSTGIYHRYAQRYKQILARSGVVVQERLTEGAYENLQLLRRRDSGVDVAFMQGGVEEPLDSGGLEMIAALYYEPLWIFHRPGGELDLLNELRGKRIGRELNMNGHRGGERDTTRLLARLLRALP